jgi:hypothetical protein
MHRATMADFLLGKLICYRLPLLDFVVELAFMLLSMPMHIAEDEIWESDLQP